MSQHRQAWLVAASLPDGHPDRTGLEDADDETLRAGAALGALLDRAPREPGPGAALAVLAAIRAEVSADLTRRRRPLALAVLLVAIVASLGAALGAADLGRFALLEGSVCFSVEVIAAALPLFGLVLLGPGLAHSGPQRTAAIAAAGALVAQLGLLGLCPEHDGAHIFLFHAGGVLVAAAVGALAGWLPRRLVEA